MPRLYYWKLDMIKLPVKNQAEHIYLRVKDIKSIYIQVNISSTNYNKENPTVVELYSTKGEDDTYRTCLTPEEVYSMVEEAETI